jgi:hypothetical protein
MNEAERWLHETLGALRDDPGAELPEKARTGVEALQAAGVLDAGSAAGWLQAFKAEANGERDRPPADPELAARADRFLASRLEPLQRDPEWDDVHVQRFEGALDLLRSVGAVDGREWDARFRERVGWPAVEDERAQERALNAGGTEAELLAVIPGPDQVLRGHRLLLVLRFADGVSFAIDKDPEATPEIDWPGWELTDDLGTAYRGGGFGGSSEEEHCSFRTPVPAGARRLRLTLDDHPDVTFEVEL